MQEGVCEQKKKARVQCLSDGNVQYKQIQWHLALDILQKDLASLPDLILTYWAELICKSVVTELRVCHLSLVDATTLIPRSSEVSWGEKKEKDKCGREGGENIKVNASSVWLLIRYYLLRHK